MKPLYILALLLVACTPQKRLDRIISRHPELVRTDTITVVDTVYLPGDTIHAARWAFIHDTITVENERQVVRVVRMPTGSPCDTAKIALGITGIVKPDSIPYQVKVPCDSVNVTQTVNKIPWYVWLLLLALALALAIQTVRK